MTSPIEITAPAAIDIATHGASTGIVSIPVSNRGTLVLSIKPVVENETATAKAYPAAQYVTCPAKTLTVQPGQTVTLVCHVTLPSPSFNGETQVVLDAKPVSSGSIQVTGGVATTVKFGKVQTVAYQAQPFKPSARSSSNSSKAANGSLAIPGHGSHSSGSGLLYGTLAGALLVAVVAAVLLRRMTRHTGTRGVR